MMTVEQIARVCHEANRAICEGSGETPYLSWEKAPRWQGETMIKGVQFVLDNPGAPASANHEAWMQDKLADGWVYGPVKDPAAKTHPCLVPYDDLPFEQRVKDHVMRAIVKALI
jgi:hypothetical protein